MAAAMTALAIVFWSSVALIVYAHLGYPLLLALLARRRGRPEFRWPQDLPLPFVSVVVPAYAEEEVIERRIANLRDEVVFPRSKLEVIVACDGSPDRTAELARAAGADLVLELPRGGKVRAQDAAARRARGEILAFSDANANWAADALLELIKPFADRRVGYACGEVRLVGEDGTNQEGLYWRYELAMRARESRLRSVTGGNGAIYATRRDAYVEVDPVMGHDLSFPFTLVKRGWLALYNPAAIASEKMVPSLEGEFARKRRMMAHTWPIVIRGGLLSPRGYGAVYALMIFSHRALRYLTPFLHLVALGTGIALIGQGWIYVAAVVIQGAVLLAAVAAGVVRWRPLLLARYYVLTTASLIAGLWDWLRHGVDPGWEPAEGTR
jgi:cellulose synthase/poly-beta-1,6-N-acetylglucosamine synthase-like glycosyltransferase